MVATHGDDGKIRREPIPDYVQYAYGFDLSTADSAFDNGMHSVEASTVIKVTYQKNKKNLPPQSRVR